jgi:drug/metabolite transporter (DMT)-like permease
VIAIAGLGIVFSSELRADVPLERIGAVLVAALFGAITVIVQRAFPRTHPIATNAVGTLVGVPLLLVASGIAGERSALPQLTATWLAVGYLVLSTVVGFVILTWLILRWSPTAPAYGTVLGPIVTIVLATLLAGETFGPLFFVGGAIVLLGTYLGAIASAGRVAPRAAPTPAD